MVSAIGAGGVSLAFLKPVYLEILYVDDISNEFYVETEKYSPTEHTPYNIYGRASYFKGFDEMQMQVGSYLKAGFSFEFSKEDEVIRSIEAGISIDAFKIGDNAIVGDTFGKELPIMAIAKNKKTFLSFYINMNFFFGKKW